MFDYLADDLSHDQAVSQFYDKGLLFYSKGFDQNWTTQAFQIGMNIVENSVLPQSSLSNGIGKEYGTSTWVQRSQGRFDIKLDWLKTSLFDGKYVPVQQVWYPVLESLLGKSMKLAIQGMVIALPGAEEQTWHIDGDHLFQGPVAHLPPHCINVFIPLIDLDEENGPTELCPGSQFLTNNIDKIYSPSLDHFKATNYKGQPVKTLFKKGSIIVFEYRVLHRGLPNLSTFPRPILYLTFAKHWFKDRTFPGESTSIS